MSPIEEHLMSTSESSSTSPQDQYLEAVREGQEAWAELAVEVLTLDRMALTRFTRHVAGPTQSHATRLTRSAG
jgi:hypothetical protein